MSLGGLAILAGSHTVGVLRVHAAEWPGGVGIDTDQLGLTWYANDLCLGDALDFHRLTVHKALPNTTKVQIRFSVDYCYQAVSQPIMHDGLDPHYSLVG